MFPLFFEQAKSAAQGEERALQPVERCIDAPASRNDNHIESGTERILMQAISLADAAARTVAHHGVSQLFADSDANAVFTELIFPEIDTERLIGGGFTLRIDPAKGGIFFQTVRKSHSIHRSSQ